MVRAVLAASAVAALAFAGIPSNALATARDISVTYAYLRAAYIFERASKDSMPAERAILTTLVTEVRKGCPNVATQAPHNELAATFSEEALVAVSDTALSEDRGAITHFSDALQRLRWSNPVITRAVARYRSRLTSELALRPPDLCSDLRQWAADGFGAAPPDVIRSIQDAQAASAGPIEVPARLLRPYVRTVEQALVHRTERLKAEVSATLISMGLKATAQILSATGLGE